MREIDFRLSRQKLPGRAEALVVFVGLNANATALIDGGDHSKGLLFARRKPAARDKADSISDTKETSTFVEASDFEERRL